MYVDGCGKASGQNNYTTPNSVNNVPDNGSGSIFEKAKRMHGELDNAQSAYGDFAQSAMDDYKEFKEATRNEFDETVQQNKQEMKDFTEDANGKMLSFKADAIKEKKSVR